MGLLRWISKWIKKYINEIKKKSKTDFMNNVTRDNVSQSILLHI